MIRRIAPALAVVLFALPTALVAQQEFAAGSPEGTALAYVESLKEGQLEKMSSMMHPEALADFRGMLQPVLDLAEKSPEGSSEMLQMFDGVKSVAELRKLNNEKFFASFYSGITSLQPELVEALKTAETEVLGHIMEGDDIAHVLYRISVNAGVASAKKTEVMSMRRTKSGWGILLSGEIEGMAEGIRQSLEMQE